MIMEAARARGCRSVVMNSKTKTTKRIQHDFRARVTRPTRISHRQDLSALLWRDFAEGSLELNGHAMDHEEAEGHEERQQGGEDVRPEMMAFQLPVPFDAGFTPSGLGGV